MLEKTALFALGLVVGVVIGAGSSYVSLHYHHPKNRWIELTKEGKGLAFKNDAFFDVDIPMPDMSPPAGQAKFVDRGLGRGNELGFVVKTTMNKLDTNKLPAKYKKTEQRGEYTIGPTDTVVYTSHIEFTLKDADGFVLMTTNSEPVSIWSGRENTLQGIAKDEVPENVVTRTEEIQMLLVADKCDTCIP